MAQSGSLLPVCGLRTRSSANASRPSSPHHLHSRTDARSATPEPSRPIGSGSYCIVDNLSAHGTPAVEAFLDEHPQVFLHRTPTHASWLNQVELWFSIMERRLIRNGEFDSVDHLADRIIEFIKAYNRQARPFRWTYDARPLKVA